MTKQKSPKPALKPCVLTRKQGTWEIPCGGAAGCNSRSQFCDGGECSTLTIPVRMLYVSEVAAPLTAGRCGTPSRLLQASGVSRCIHARFPEIRVSSPKGFQVAYVNFAEPCRVLRSKHRKTIQSANDIHQMLVLQGPMPGSKNYLRPQRYPVVPESQAPDLVPRQKL